MLIAPREVTDRELNALDTEIRELLRDVGVQKQAAFYARVDQQRVSNWGNPHHREQATARGVLLLEAAAGNTRVTEILAELHGLSLVALPPVLQSGQRIDQITGKLLGEIGELISRLSEARVDNRFCEKDRDLVRPEICDAIAVLVTMLREIDAPEPRP